MAMLKALLHFHSDPFTFLPYVFKMHSQEKHIVCVIKPQDNPTTCTSSEDATELSQ